MTVDDLKNALCYYVVLDMQKDMKIAALEQQVASLTPKPPAKKKSETSKLKGVPQ